MFIKVIIIFIITFITIFSYVFYLYFNLHVMSIPIFGSIPLPLFFDVYCHAYTNSFCCYFHIYESGN